MFLKDKNGKLKFKAVYKDPHYVDISEMKEFKYIYSNTGSADSGGPIMIKRLIFYKENLAAESIKNRNIIVGITSISSGISKGKDSLCINIGTKVSQDVVDWIKKMDNGDFSFIR